MKSLFLVCVVALLLVTARGQQKPERLEFLLPPRSDFRWGIGLSNFGRDDGKSLSLNLSITVGSQSWLMDLPFVHQPGLDELRRLVMAEPTSGRRHLDLSWALWLRAAGESLRHARLDTASTDREAEPLKRDARFHGLQAEWLLREELATAPSEATQLAYADCLRSLGRGGEEQALIAELVESHPTSWAALLRMARMHYDKTFGQQFRMLGKNGYFDATFASGSEHRHALIERAIASAPDRPEPYLARFGQFFDLALAELDPTVTGDRAPALIERLRADVRNVRDRAHDRDNLIAWSHVTDAMLIVFSQAIATFHEEGAPTDVAARGLPALLEFATKMAERALPEDLGTLHAADQFFVLHAADPILGRAACFGRVFTAIGTADWDGAIARFAELRELLPDLDAAFETVLLLTGPLKRFEGAKVEISEMRAWFDQLDGSSSSCLPHFVTATWACRRGLFEYGERAYRIAVSKAPHMPDAWVGLGVAVLRTGGNRGEARAAFERALSRPPRAASEAVIAAVAHYGLGLIAAEQGRWSEAVGHFETAGQLDPEHPGVPREHAHALEELDRIEHDPDRMRAALLLELRAAQLLLKEHGRKGQPDAFVGPSLGVDPLAQASACIVRATGLEDQAGLVAGELLHMQLERLTLQADVARARSSPTEERATVDAIAHVMHELGEQGRTAEHAFVLARALAALDQEGDRLDDAVLAAEEAVHKSLGRDPDHLVLVARIHQAAGRAGAAIDALEQAIEVYGQMFGDAVPPDRGRAETLLMQLYYQDSRWQRFVALCDQRVNRLTASRVDLMYAALLHLEPIGAMMAAYDPQRARGYALRAAKLGLTPLPEARLVLSFVYFRCGDLDLSLQTAREALAEQRRLEGESEKLADGGAEIAGFFSKLAYLLEQEPWREKGPQSEWRAAWSEMLTREERARVTR